MKSASFVKDSPVECGGLQLDPGRFEARYHDQDLNLTLSEFRMLYLLMKNPGFVCTREALINEASPCKNNSRPIVRIVDVHVAALRRKMANGQKIIETVRGLGYRLNSHQCSPA